MNEISEKLVSRLTVPISSLTAYDYPSARIADEAGVQLILVGDSLGMVVAGNDDTTSVTLDQMAYHTAMVARGAKNAVIVADLPINTYRTPEETVRSATVLLEAGADAVKLEGGFRQLEKVEVLSENKIPMMAHIGMLPQRVVEEGGYKKKGKTIDQAKVLVESAMALEKAGAFSIVLESVVPSVSSRIAQAISIPTIGIGSGDDCSGQIRVLHDVIGAYPWFVPPFAKVYGDVAGVMKKSIEQYCEELK